MKNWYLIPLAAVAGIIAGAWGPRADLEALKEMRSEKAVKSEANAKSGFGAIANLVNIPDRARKSRVESVPAQTNREEFAEAADRVHVAADTNRWNRTQRRAVWRDRADLKNRIEDAKELWRTRCELARTQWKAKLNVSGEEESRFDEMVDAMNADLKDLMGEFAAEVAATKDVSPELGVKMMSAFTRTLAEGYDAIGECVGDDVRGEVSNIPLHEFIDPSVIEPMIQVQDYLEPRGFNVGDEMR